MMGTTAIAIVAIVCFTAIKLLDTIFKKHNDSVGSEKGKLMQEIALLKERVETLEKIVTDEKYNLNKEFENLKKD